MQLWANYGALVAPGVLYVACVKEAEETKRTENKKKIGYVLGPVLPEVHSLNRPLFR